MLNPTSNYFKEKYQDKNSYTRKNIKHRDIREIKGFISKYFSIENQGYFLGIKKRRLVDADNPSIASLHTLEGIKI
jgi:hypothetical protein